MASSSSSTQSVLNREYMIDGSKNIDRNHSVNANDEIEKYKHMVKQLNDRNAIIEHTCTECHEQLNDMVQAYHQRGALLTQLTCKLTALLELHEEERQDGDAVASANNDSNNNDRENAENANNDKQLFDAATIKAVLNSQSAATDASNDLICSSTPYNIRMSNSNSTSNKHAPAAAVSLPVTPLPPLRIKSSTSTNTATARHLPPTLINTAYSTDKEFTLSTPASTQPQPQAYPSFTSKSSSSKNPSTEFSLPQWLIKQLAVSSKG
jgi:hypothetical protein